MYGRRAPWEDPADWIIEEYPWTNQGEGEWPSLLRLRPEDVGYDSQGAPTSGKGSTPGAAQSDAEGDPLVSMGNIYINKSIHINNKYIKLH